MKTLLAITILSLSMTGFAKNTKKATAAERELFCSQIEKALEKQEYDGGIDYDKCRSSKKIVSRLLTEDEVLVRGPINVISHSGFVSKNTCELIYAQGASEENIINEIECVATK